MLVDRVHCTNINTSHKSHGEMHLVIHTTDPASTNLKKNHQTFEYERARGG